MFFIFTGFVVCEIYGFWEMDLGFWEIDLDEEGRTILGFWGLGRREWDGRWKRKKRKKGKEKKNEGRRWWTENQVLKTRVLCGSFSLP